MKSTNKSKKRRADVNRNTPLVAVLIVLRLFAFPTPSRIEPGPASYASEVNVLEVQRDYTTTQAAVEAANTGDTIRVAAGVYNENVSTATAGRRLYAGSGTVIDGAGLTGRERPVFGTAAHLVADAELSGFEVNDSHRGIGWLPKIASEAMRFTIVKCSRAGVVPGRAVGIDLSGLPFCVTPHLLEDLHDHTLWERYSRKRSRRRNRGEGTSNFAKVVLSIVKLKQGHSRA